MNKHIGREKEIRRFHIKIQFSKCRIYSCLRSSPCGKDISVKTLYESKFSLTKFRIDKKYSEKLRKKSDAFRQATRTSNALILKMITTYGVEQNQYAGTIQNDLNMDMLFREIM